ncbi:hypothetical protein N7485_005077 [Penicillium canescens]|nr:hypothetical protein N7485_005350 [Penicillium canescens]KAJ6175272.1 hypothetical protein N7485_005077 [Penicillium canescens]
MALEVERSMESCQQVFSLDITPFIAEAASSPVVIGLEQRTCFPSTPEESETPNFSLVASELSPSVSSQPDGVVETGSTDAAYAPLENHTNAAAFFRARLGSRNSRATYLARALQGLINAMELDGATYANLWSTRERIFSGVGTSPVARFQRLFHGFLRVKRGRDDYDCASRLFHIFLDHDLEQLATSDLLRLSRGRGRKSAALSLQAASISASIGAVKADRKAGQRYMQILMDAGPGLLLMLGSQINTV